LSESDTSNLIALFGGFVTIDLQLTISEIVSDIRTIKKSKQVWLWIEKHAETINASPYGSAFGMIQRMAYIDIFAALGRVFESGRYSISTLERELNASVPNIKDCEQLRRVIMVRHRHVAHNVAVKSEDIDVKFDDVDYCVEWVEKFIQGLKVQHQLHLTIESFPCPVMALRRLTHEAGVVIMPTSVPA